MLNHSLSAWMLVLLLALIPSWAPAVGHAAEKTQELPQKEREFGVLTAPQAQEHDLRDYNIKNNYCGLLAHSSALLTDPTTEELIIVLNGGLASFKVEKQLTARDAITKELITRSEWHIVDVHAATAILKLQGKFSLDKVAENLEILKVDKVGDNSYAPDITSRGYMWMDATGSIFLVGGFFSRRPYWNESSFHLEQDEIPPFRIWKLEVAKRLWTQIVPQTLGDKLKRLVSSAATSIPSLGLSFAFAGHLSLRSEAGNVPGPRGFGNWATNGMVMYNHTSNRVYNISDNSNPMGYHHGSLHHIGPFEDHKGLLLALPSAEFRRDYDFEGDVPGEGKSYDFTKIRFFNIETEQWITQQATYFNGAIPPTRTRFCSVLVRDGETGPWDLYIYGGQGTGIESNSGDIWVLTMPSFIWVKVDGQSKENNPIRGHTCHAVGNQMVVVGGYPPSKDPDPEAECDTGLVKVFDMSAWSWPSEFRTGTVYKQPDTLVEKYSGETAPDVDGTLISLLVQRTTEIEIKHKSRPPLGPIIGAAIGGFLLVLIVVICFVIPRAPQRILQRIAGFGTRFREIIGTRGANPQPPGGANLPPSGGADLLPPGGADLLPPGGADLLPPGGADLLPPGGADLLPPGGADLLPPGGANLPPHGHNLSAGLVLA